MEDWSVLWRDVRQLGLAGGDPSVLERKQGCQKQGFYGGVLLVPFDGLGERQM